MEIQAPELMEVATTDLMVSMGLTALTDLTALMVKAIVGPEVKAVVAIYITTLLMEVTVAVATTAVVTATVAATS